MGQERKKKENKKSKKTGLFIFHVTPGGKRLADGLKNSVFPEACLVRYRGGAVEGIWERARGLVFITAAGIAVRAIAPFVKDKKEDPAVVVIDEKGENVVSLLSGHLGGANALAREIAAFTKGNAVITTATDVNSLTPIDLFAIENGLVMENPEALPQISSRHLGKGKLKIYAGKGFSLPMDYERVKSPGRADVVVSNKVMGGGKKYFHLRPKNLVLGIGLNSGTGADEIEGAVASVFSESGLSMSSIRFIATHEKKAAESGLVEFAGRRGLGIKGFGSGEINSVPGVAQSDAAKRALGVQAVAEPAAVIGAGGGRLIVRKKKKGNLTVAVAEMPEGGKNLYVVGTGPGGLSHITPRALEAIRRADVIVGYKTYLEHIGPLIKGKEITASSMTEEVARVKAAVELAATGRRVCLVSGGDPGIYGMAGLAIEVALAGKFPVRIEVIPGISALNACASQIGAPLMHDFAVVSLSDRLTPWDVIEKRLEAAARADFVIVIYNPKSGGRRTQIEKAREIILRHRAAGTPVGIVRSATREDGDAVVTTIEKMLEHEINMRTTVIIGNSMSVRTGGYMVTPRGYERKYTL
ncbi:MAG: precorrin-3B C(17)-methyltransferase [Nitrospiraceae bacterium]|nr:precorrin-3B C(17)-methyltransferase [Nitrospiraceae bacterium]